MIAALLHAPLLKERREEDHASSYCWVSLCETLSEEFCFMVPKLKQPFEPIPFILLNYVSNCGNRFDPSAWAVQLHWIFVGLHVEGLISSMTLALEVLGRYTLLHNIHIIIYFRYKIILQNDHVFVITEIMIIYTILFTNW